jgi:hypothetical protein
LDFTNNAGQFMAEGGGRHNHFRMVATLENLQICATSERSLDLNPYFAGLEWKRCDIFDLNIFLAVENGRFHGHSVWLQTVKAEEKFLPP